MRPVLINDVTTAARALLAVPAVDRMALAASLIGAADVADRYTRRLGRVHGEYGDGTLANAARKYELADEPTLDDLAYCECLELVVLQLIARRM
jgi:hypothetical protein